MQGYMGFLVVVLHSHTLLRTLLCMLVHILLLCTLDYIGLKKTLMHLLRPYTCVVAWRTETVGKTASRGSTTKRTNTPYHSCLCGMLYFVYITVIDKFKY